MKYAIRGISAIFALAIIYLTAAFFVPAARFGPVCAPAYALMIHLGLVDVKTADWGYLQLRSGDTGAKALRWIERNSAPDTARVAAAVQEQWVGAGHVFDYGYLSTSKQEKETRFADLRLPDDAMTARQALSPGQSIPDSFWRDLRFRACAHLEDGCILRMADLTGDATPEVIVERDKAWASSDLFVNPVVKKSWTVYGKTWKGWDFAGSIDPCDVERSTPNLEMIPSNQKLDMLWVDGQAVNFFRAGCFLSTTTTTTAPASERKAAAENIKAITTYPHLPSSRPFPASLEKALISRQIILTSDEWPLTHLAAADKGYKPSFQSLPPCFTSPRQCALFVTDLNHDGRDDVIVFDAEVRKVSAKYRLVSLLMETHTGWRVVDNHAVCVSAPFENMKVELKPSKWRPIAFAGNLLLPDEETDACTEADRQHFH